MNNLFLSLIVFAVSATDGNAFFEASCPNCSVQQARSAALEAVPDYGGGVWRAYIHDLETLRFYAFDVIREVEPGFSWNRVIDVNENDIPNHVIKDRDAAYSLMGDVVFEPFDPVIVAPDDYESAYDVVDNQVGLQQIWKKYVDDRSWYGYKFDTLLGMASTLLNKVSNVNNGVAYHFVDGSRIGMVIVAYWPDEGKVVLEFSWAEDKDGNPVFQDVDQLGGSTLQMDLVTDSVTDFFDRNNVTLRDLDGALIGNLTGSSAKFVCSSTATGVMCAVDKH